MNKAKKNHEVWLVTMAIICAGLSVFGHLILAKSFADRIWTEYTAAAIPFVMLALCWGAIRYAARANAAEDSHKASQ